MYSLMQSPALNTPPTPVRSRRGWGMLLAFGTLLCPAWGYAEANTAPESVRALFHSIEVSAEQAAQTTGATLRASRENARRALEELREESRDLLRGARAQGARTKRAVLDSRDELARWLGLMPPYMPRN